jgi:hypothetical protein
MENIFSYLRKGLFSPILILKMLHTIRVLNISKGVTIQHLTTTRSATLRSFIKSPIRYMCTKPEGDFQVFKKVVVNTLTAKNESAGHWGKTIVIAPLTLRLGHL